MVLGLIRIIFLKGLRIWDLYIGFSNWERSFGIEGVLLEVFKWRIYELCLVDGVEIRDRIMCVKEGKMRNWGKDVRDREFF